MDSNKKFCSSVISIFQKSKSFVFFLLFILSISFLIGWAIAKQFSLKRTPALQKIPTPTFSPITPTKIIDNISPSPLRSNLELTLKDDSLSLNKKSEVYLDLHGAPVVGAYIYLKYDPNMITIESIENGKVFDVEISKNINDKDGQIQYAAVLSANSGKSPQTGRVLTLSIKPIKTGTTEILLDKEKTQLAYKGENTLDKSRIVTIPLYIK